MDREILTSYLRELYSQRASALAMANGIGARMLSDEIEAVEKQINEIPVLIDMSDGVSDAKMKQIDRAIRMERIFLRIGIVVLALFAAVMFTLASALGWAS